MTTTSNTVFAGSTPPIKTASALVMFAICVALGLAAYSGLVAIFIAQKAEETPTRAQFFVSGIDGALERLAHLPYVIAVDQITRDTLDGADPAPLNHILATVADKANAEFVFVMDINGDTVATSNAQSDTSLIGNNYRFRPYFRDAISGDIGRFYAVGATTGRPGYFIAEPIRDAHGTVFGVVVVKLGFKDISDALSESGERILVTNAQDVVIASSDPTLIYGVLHPLTPFDERTLREQRQFGSQALVPLNWKADGERRVSLNDTTHLWTKADLRNEDWTVHLLTDIRDIRLRALFFVTIGVALLLAIAIAAALWRAAQLRDALLVSNADRQRLTKEIEDRRTAEARLSKAQDELARKNRMAALGQLSASITHELGQPISAMRNYLVAEEIAANTLPGALSPQLTGLLDRMQGIVDQLRSFGRNSRNPDATFNLADSVSAALGLVIHTARERGITINTEIENAKIVITGVSQRFEQVVVNLLQNAIDAAAEGKTGSVNIQLESNDKSASIVVSDSGSGIGALTMNDLREPFFTTKPSGKGMGLGLAISAEIINDMGGTLTAQNGETNGAVFTITLPKADPNHA